MASLHTITHDHTISVWFYESDTRCGYVYAFACQWGREEGEGAGRPGQGLCHRHGRTKTAHLKADRHGDTSGTAQTESRVDTCMQTHTNTDPPPTTTTTRRLSVAFLSLPLAVSQIPNDVLTGGLSDWRWGCVMTDQGLYQWPAHCQLAVWRLTGRLKPKTAAFPARLPASLHFFSYFFFSFFFFFNP